MRQVTSLLLYALLILCFGVQAGAEQIHLCTDSKGKSYYCSTASPDSSPVVLPELTKEPGDERIKRIEQQTPKHCGNHGGVDCSLGPDADGSVICADSYRDAILPFRFKCLEAKLAIEDLSLEKDPESSLSEIVLVVKNNSSTPAESVSAEFDLPDAGKLKADGPDTIGAYGLGEFRRATSASTSNWKGTDAIRYKVNCSNCREKTQGQVLIKELPK